jgi:CheY-like chemotaxis protein
MSNNPQTAKRILFVDDNASFLNMIEKVFGKWSFGSWQIVRAADAGKALAIIEEQLVDVIIVEPELPSLDGLQFVRLLERRFANIPKAIFTAKPSPEVQAAALNAGAELCLEKPSTIEAMEIAYAAINELTKWRPTNGFLGIMWCANLHEILQIECMNQSSCIMEITSGTTRGKVFIKDGSIQHAHADHHKGAMALAYLLTFKGGHFFVRPFADPPEVTIEGSWEGLLMEAAQTRDEEGTAFFRKPAKKDPAALENWEDTHHIPRPETGGTAATEDLFTPKTEELLVVSDTGEVFFAWQCGQPQARVELINALQTKARELANSLGTFDRIEIKNGDLHTVARVKNESKVFLRVNRPAEMPA